MPIGIDDFQKIREEHYYFVDKTDFIRQLIDAHSAVTLINAAAAFRQDVDTEYAGIFLFHRKRSTEPSLI
ncbi:AAA family ATPase [Megasphaera elsdenii]|uniref:AAA family ATPase n=1 Tax=Megasphaera elsdenii TaxID=907 RepID=UPI00242E3F4F|nr:AAA family ATPase [Megasphaera elsdenii]